MRTEKTLCSFGLESLAIKNSKEEALSPVTDLSIKLAKDRIKSFPSTRYYGSKRRLLFWIYKHIKDIQFTTVLDGFGGTGTVSLLYRAMGKHVTFNDALLSNTVSAQALLANNLPYDDCKEVEDFFAQIVPTKGFISRTFSGKFYLDDENEWLDGAITRISSLEEAKKVALLYSLFQACLQKRPFNLFHRANLNLRTARSQRQRFGNQTTWDTPFPTLASRAYGELSNAFYRTKVDHTILQSMDVRQIPAGFDLVYLDPPYIGSKNGDDYLRRYHFLEGLCQYEHWPKLIDKTYNNYQFLRKNHISDWQNRSLFKDRLFNLVKKHCDSIVVLSYVDNAYPSKGVISECFEELFHHHRVIEKELPHALSKGNKVELLFIGFPE